uniref:Peptidase M20 n=1 Tax=Solibacter usitatus (strain Ellin6076) TaxID=234267 RepID=Q02AW5_SOLUE
MRLFAALLVLLPLHAQTSDQRLAREIFKQLIEINTTDSSGDNTRAAEAMAARFRAAGFPAADVQVLAPVPRKGNLVVRLHGTGTGRPILFLGHLDVVEARRSDWPWDPFEFREQEGYFYGRGTSDMKGDDATLVAAFLRMKRENFQPSRDLILALTSDEEGGPANGVDWLVTQHRALIDAQFCINTDAGGGHIKNGKHVYMAMQAAEKVFLSFKLEVTNNGGHSSLPVKDNAIYHLADGLSRLSKFDFPVRLFDVTRAAFERSANVYGGQLGADLKTMVQNPADPAAVARLSAIPFYNAQMRTTCVATMLSGGHAENALPAVATAVVNCRLLPIDNAADVKRTLQQVLADPKIQLDEMKEPVITPYKPIDPDVMAAVAASTARLWPGLPVVPTMDTGASDGIYLIRAGIPTYGVSGIFGDEDDVRAHGRNERILVQSFDQGVDFIYDLATRLARSN